jgi:predicted transcriptional regulator YdeE
MACPITEIRSINLKETPEVVIWPATHYLGVEKVGPFSETAPACWKELHSNHLPKLREHDQSLLTQKYFSLFNIDKMIYGACAGCNTHIPLEFLKEGKESMLFEGGKYARFHYIGSYAGFAQAWGRVMELIKEQSLSVREEAFFIEHYDNDPMTTPENELSTFLLVPIN